MFPLTVVLLSSNITLLVPYGYGGGGYDGLVGTLGIKPGAYNLGSCGPGAYNLPVWLIIISLLSWCA